MKYKPIKWKKIKSLRKRKVIMHADMLFRDLYGIFKLPIDKKTGEGAGNFSILLVLLCIIDGISVHLYPTKKKISKQGPRFKKLIIDMLDWGPVGKNWLKIDLGAKYLYLEFRNPLVHELGVDRITGPRKNTYEEPAISKWGKIPKKDQRIEYVERLRVWNSNWPTLYVEQTSKGGRVTVCAAALYWSVKKLVGRLV